MKKKLLFVVLALTNFSIFSQLTCDFTSIRENYRANATQITTETRGSDGCINAVKFEFIIPNLLESRTGWNAYHYGYDIKLIGLERYDGGATYAYSDSRETLLNEEVYPALHESGGYSLSVTISKEMIDNYLLPELDSNKWNYSINAYLYLTKYISNNDPDLTIFRPCTWEYPVLIGSINNVSQCLNPDDSGQADLQIVENEVRIKDGCRNCDDYYDLSHSFVLYNKHESSLGFFIPVKNAGPTASSSTKLSFYTLHYLVIGGWHKIKVLTIDVPPIAPGETRIFGPHIIDGYHRFNQILSNSHYIIIEIDPDNNVLEYNEYNNELSVLVDFRSKDDVRWSSKGTTPILVDNPKDDDDTIGGGIKSAGKEYQIIIYDFYGRLIHRALVKNKTNEFEEMKRLGLKGFYIVKTGDNSRKIYVSN